MKCLTYIGCVLGAVIVCGYNILCWEVLKALLFDTDESTNMAERASMAMVLTVMVGLEVFLTYAFLDAWKSSVERKQRLKLSRLEAC